MSFWIPSTVRRRPCPGLPGYKTGGGSGLACRGRVASRVGETPPKTTGCPLSLGTSCARPRPRDWSQALARVLHAPRACLQPQGNRSWQGLAVAATGSRAMAAAARVSEVKAEGLLRGACTALAAAAALLVGLSTQTETVLLVRKKATVKDVQALW
jgi:hypothetical protein